MRLSQNGFGSLMETGDVCGELADAAQGKELEAGVEARSCSPYQSKRGKVGKKTPSMTGVLRFLVI